jgi:type IV secretion system protein VirB5
MNLFKSHSLRFGRAPEPVTPYQRAGQLWDDYVGSARAQMRHWRMITFGLCGVMAIIGADNLRLRVEATVVPFLVEIDPTGALLGVEKAGGSRKLSDVQLAYQLGRFISNFRSKSTDPVVIKQNWLDAYAFASGQARQTLNDLANRNDPFANIGHKTVSVEINSVVRLSDTSMQARWTERSYDDGALASTDRYVGVLTVLERPARGEDALRANPFGFTVDAISFTKEN